LGTPLGVATSHGHFDTQDSSRPGLGGSHHLPPYSILCSSPPRLHSNGTFSRDSQGGVPKLSRLDSRGLWLGITSRPNLRSGRGLDKCCSLHQELSNAVLLSLKRRREKVDSRLLVVGSQTASLTPGPSFACNLGCKCPNDSCEAILDIYAPRSFQWHKERSNARRFDPSNRLLNFRESQRTPSLPLLGVEIAFSHFAQNGLRHFQSKVVK